MQARRVDRETVAVWALSLVFCLSFWTVVVYLLSRVW